MADDDGVVGPSVPWTHMPWTHKAVEGTPMLGICPIAKPRSIDFLSALSRGDLIWTSILCAVTVATIGIYIEEIYHMSVYVKSLRLKRKAIVLLGLYPVTSFNAMLILLMPRADGVADLTIVIYYALCMFLFSQLIFHHYGGKDEMYARLQHQRIPLRSPPCCCCCVCLPSPPLTSRWRLEVLELCVMQFVIVKPLGLYVMALVLIDAGPVGLIEDQFTVSMIYQTLAVLDLSSTLLAVYGNMVLLGIANLGGAQANLKKKFYVLKGVLLLRNLQEIIIAILVSTGVVTCTNLLDVQSQSKRIDAELVIVEMLILSVIARVYYRYDVTTQQPEDEISILGEDDDIEPIPSNSGTVYGSLRDSQDAASDHVITEQIRSDNADANSIEFRESSRYQQ